MTIQEARRILKESLGRPGHPQPRDNPQPLELLRVREAADLCGLNPRTLWKRIKKGELAAWGSPRRVRISDVLLPFDPGAKTNRR